MGLLTSPSTVAHTDARLLPAALTLAHCGFPHTTDHTPIRTDERKGHVRQAALALTDPLHTDTYRVSVWRRCPYSLDYSQTRAGAQDMGDYPKGTKARLEAKKCSATIGISFRIFNMPWLNRRRPGRKQRC